MPPGRVLHRLQQGPGHAPRDTLPLNPTAPPQVETTYIRNTLPLHPATPPQVEIMDLIWNPFKYTIYPSSPFYNTAIR